LVTFNDYGPDIKKNVEVVLDTSDIKEFGRATANLRFESFDGGRDSRERMTQGLVVALRSAAPRTLIVVFTDNGTKDLRLENEIVRLREEKDIEVSLKNTRKKEIQRNVEAICSKIPRFTSFSLLSLRATSMAKVCQHTEEWAKFS